MKRVATPAALALASALLVACPAGGGPPSVPEPDALPRARIQIGLQVISVEVAETAEQKSQGLSDRPTLASGHGMWFPYPTPGRTSFWMRRMHFPLDFVWVRDGAIVDLAENVSPAGGRASRVRPRTPAEGVLEVPAGTVARWGWKVGDPVRVVPAAD